MVDVSPRLAPWAAALWTPSRYKAAHGGRATGKSHNFAAALVEKLRDRPMRWLCCREIQASLAESSKKVIESKIEAHGLSDFYTITDRDIRGANGSVFLFAGLGSDPEKIKSMEALDGAWISEANTVSRRSIELLEPTVRVDGSEIWADWNPDKESDPIDAMFRGEKGPPPDSIVIEVTAAMNPWFPKALLERMEWDRLNDPDKYQHVWLGGYRRISEATVFRNWEIRDFEAPDDARLHFGADWGYSVDPTVVTRSFVGRLGNDGAVIADTDGDCLFVEHEAYKHNCSIDDTPALFDTVPDIRRWPVVADSARPEMIDSLQSKGFQIRAAKKGPGSVEGGISYLKQFRIIVHPRCKHVADEMALMAWQTDKRTSDVIPKLVAKHDHCIDSLRYAHEGMRRREGRAIAASSGGRTGLVDMWGPGIAQTSGYMWD